VCLGFRAFLIHCCIQENLQYHVALWLISLVKISYFSLTQDAYRLQLKLFLYEVKQQQLLSGIRSYLKLYSSITISKLAQYMEVDEATLRSVSRTTSVSKFVVLFMINHLKPFGQVNSDDIQAQNACS
jgi:hypothetical protein